MTLLPLIPVKDTIDNALFVSCAPVPSVQSVVLGETNGKAKLQKEKSKYLGHVVSLFQVTLGPLLKSTTTSHHHSPSSLHSGNEGEDGDGGDWQVSYAEMLRLLLHPMNPLAIRREGLAMLWKWLRAHRHQLHREMTVQTVHDYSAIIGRLFDGSGDGGGTGGVLRLLEDSMDPVLFRLCTQSLSQEGPQGQQKSKYRGAKLYKGRSSLFHQLNDAANNAPRLRVTPEGVQKTALTLLHDLLVWVTCDKRADKSQVRLAWYLVCVAVLGPLLQSNNNDSSNPSSSSSSCLDMAELLPEKDFSLSFNIDDNDGRHSSSPLAGSDAVSVLCKFVAVWTVRHEAACRQWHIIEHHLPNGSDDTVVEVEEHALHNYKQSVLAWDLDLELPAAVSEEDEGQAPSLEPTALFLWHDVVLGDKDPVALIWLHRLIKHALCALHPALYYYTNANNAASSGGSSRAGPLKMLLDMLRTWMLCHRERRPDFLNMAFFSAFDDAQVSLPNQTLAKEKIGQEGSKPLAVFASFAEVYGQWLARGLFKTSAILRNSVSGEEASSSSYIVSKAGVEACRDSQHFIRSLAMILDNSLTNAKPPASNTGPFPPGASADSKEVIAGCLLGLSWTQVEVCLQVNRLVHKVAAQNTNNPVLNGLHEVAMETLIGTWMRAIALTFDLNDDDPRVIRKSGREEWSKMAKKFEAFPAKLPVVTKWSEVLLVLTRHVITSPAKPNSLNNSNPAFPANKNESSCGNVFGAWDACYRVRRHGHWVWLHWIRILGHPLDLTVPGEDDPTASLVAMVDALGVVQEELLRQAESPLSSTRKDAQTSPGKDDTPPDANRAMPYGYGPGGLIVYELVPWFLDLALHGHQGKHSDGQEENLLHSHKEGEDLDGQKENCQPVHLLPVIVRTTALQALCSTMFRVHWCDSPVHNYWEAFTEALKQNMLLDPIAKTTTTDPNDKPSTCSFDTGQLSAVTTIVLGSIHVFSGIPQLPTAVSSPADNDLIIESNNTHFLLDVFKACFDTLLRSWCFTVEHALWGILPSILLCTWNSHDLPWITAVLSHLTRIITAKTSSANDDQHDDGKNVRGKKQQPRMAVVDVGLAGQVSSVMALTIAAAINQLTAAEEGDGKKETVASIIKELVALFTTFPADIGMVQDAAWFLSSFLSRRLHSPKEDDGFEMMEWAAQQLFEWLSSAPLASNGVLIGETLILLAPLVPLELARQLILATSVNDHLGAARSIWLARAIHALFNNDRSNRSQVCLEGCFAGDILSEDRSVILGHPSGVILAFRLVDEDKSSVDLTVRSIVGKTHWTLSIIDTDDDHQQRKEKQYAARETAPTILPLLKNQSKEQQPGGTAEDDDDLLAELFNLQLVKPEEQAKVVANEKLASQLSQTKTNHTDDDDKFYEQHVVKGSAPAVARVLAALGFANDLSGWSLLHSPPPPNLNTDGNKDVDKDAKTERWSLLRQALRELDTAYPSRHFLNVALQLQKTLTDAESEDEKAALGEDDKASLKEGDKATLCTPRYSAFLACLADPLKLNDNTPLLPDSIRVYYGGRGFCPFYSDNQCLDMLFLSPPHMSTDTNVEIDISGASPLKVFFNIEKQLISWLSFLFDCFRAGRFCGEMMLIVPTLKLLSNLTH